jgi:predicted nicotinamide N-methyase
MSACWSPWPSWRGACEHHDPDAEAFIAAHTALARPALVPEIELHLATEITPIWQATEDWLAERNIEPPFWAFAWPGSQALARLMLDGTVLVRGQARAGLRRRRRAGRHRCPARRGHQRRGRRDRPAGPRRHGPQRAPQRRGSSDAGGDVVGAPCRWDVILAGDVCYEAPMTQPISCPGCAGHGAGGAEVLLADPGRAYLPKDGMVAVGRFPVPTTRELEDRDSRDVTIYRVLG